MNRLDKTMLERRIRRLEKYIYEKTMGRGQNESTAFTVWKWLIDNGPSTREQVKAAFNNTALRFLGEGAKNGAVIKNGHLYSANPDYEWEDVGKVNYKGMSKSDIDNLMKDIPEDMLNDLDNQEEVPKVTPNLFSPDNVEKVKAAVESGQDINSKNSIGQTALQRICTLYDSDELLPTVKYLVENGADLDPAKEHLVTLALRSRNKEIAKYLIKSGAPTDNNTVKDAIFVGLDADTIKSIMKGGLSPFETNHIIDVLHDTYHSNRMSAKDYSELLSKQLSFGDINRSNLEMVVRNYMIVNDLNSGNTILSDYIADKLSLFPTAQFPAFLSFNQLLRSGSMLLYEYAKKVSSGNLQVKYPSDFIYIMQSVCQKVDKDFSTLGLDEKFFKKAAEESPLDIGAIAAKAFSNSNIPSNIGLLKTLVKCGNVGLRGLDGVSTWHAKSNEANSLYVKLLSINRYKSFSDQSLERIGKVASKLIVEYIIDVGLGELMVKVCKKDLSDQAKEALTEAGINFGKVKKDTRKSRELRQDTNMLVSLIKSDDSFREAERILRVNPELLENPVVIDAITDPNNDHSFTARELRKRLPKEDSTYDF